MKRIFYGHTGKWVRRAILFLLDLALVVVDEPQGAYYGSVVAAPCAGEIFQGIVGLNSNKENFE